MTKELRENIAKSLYIPAERAKRSVRDVRAELLKSVNGSIKDLNLKKQVDMSMERLFKDTMKKIDDSITAKQKEILG